MAADVRPLSVAQQELWAVYRMAPDSSAYHMVLPVRVRSPIQVPALARAVDAVAARHELLGSRFAEVDGDPVRHRPDAGPRHSPLVVRNLPGADESRLHAELGACAAVPFRLTEEGPFRVVLVRTAPDDAALAVVVHHIVSDFTTLWVVLRDLLDAYLALSAGGQPEWSPPPSTFDEYVESERRFLGSAEGFRAEQFWRGVNNGTASAELPTDRPRPAVPGLSGDTVKLHLTRDRVDQVSAAARQDRVSVFAFMLGVFQSLLYRSTGQDDFVVGCPATTRSPREIHDTVGYFVNTFPLRARFAAGTTFRDAIAAADREVTAGMANVGYPCARLAPEPTRGPFGPGHTPSLRIAFFQLALDRMRPPLAMPTEGDAEGAQIDYGGLRLAFIDLRQQEGQFDLLVRLHRGRGTLDAVLSYRTDIFDRDTITGLARRFELMLHAALAGRSTPVTRVSLLDTHELAHVLALGSGSGGERGDAAAGS